MTEIRKRIEGILISNRQTRYSLSDIITFVKCSKNEAEKELNKIKPLKDREGNYYKRPTDKTIFHYYNYVLTGNSCIHCGGWSSYEGVENHYKDDCGLLKNGYTKLEHNSFFWQQIFEMADRIGYPYKLHGDSIYIIGWLQEEIIEKVIIAYLREYLSAPNIKVQVVEKGYKLQFDSCSEYYCKDALVMLLALQKNASADGVWLALSSLE